MYFFTKSSCGLSCNFTIKLVDLYVVARFSVKNNVAINVIQSRKKYLLSTHMSCHEPSSGDWDVHKTAKISNLTEFTRECDNKKTNMNVSFPILPCTMREKEMTEIGQAGRSPSEDVTSKMKMKLAAKVWGASKHRAANTKDPVRDLISRKDKWMWLWYEITDRSWAGEGRKWLDLTGC